MQIDADPDPIRIQLITLIFISCGCGSRTRIHADPDPQHCNGGSWNYIWTTWLTCEELDLLSESLLHIQMIRNLDIPEKHKINSWTSFCNKKSAGKTPVNLSFLKFRFCPCLPLFNDIAVFWILSLSSGYLELVMDHSVRRFLLLFTTNVPHP